jgi:hypothetical protein
VSLEFFDQIRKNLDLNLGVDFSVSDTENLQMTDSLCTVVHKL